MTISFPRLPAVLGLLALLNCGAATAAITGINGGGVTNAQIFLDDTQSANASAQFGTTLYTTNQSVWGGNPLGLVFPSMPVTGDSATFAFRAFNWNLNQPTMPYGFELQNLTVTQNPTGSGYVEAKVVFRIQYQLDAGGLSAASLFLPQYVVSGTVQNGGFALAQGQVDFVSAANGLLQSVHYQYVNATPGAFTNQPLVGQAATNLGAFTLPGNDTLTIDGFFLARVDPASITISTVSAVPETSTWALFLLGLIALCGVRGRRLFA